MVSDTHNHGFTNPHAWFHTPTCMVSHTHMQCITPSTHSYTHTTHTSHPHSLKEHQGDGDSVTKLHVDMSDAVNMLLHVLPHKNDGPVMVRGKNQPPKQPGCVAVGVGGCTYVWVCICVDVHMCGCTYVWDVYMCVCICVDVHV